MKQIKRDARLVFDLIYSLFRQYRLLNKKFAAKFWHYETKNGVRFKLRTGAWDSAVIIETWWLNEYSRNLNKIKPGATIIDIGAHIGSFSVFMAKYLKKARIFAYEPNPENFDLFKENIKLNHFEKSINPFKMALTSKDRTQARLSLHPCNLGMHSIFEPSNKLAGNQKKPFISVKTLSLKSVFETNKISKCDLLKMDCEGCEYPVLLSTPDSILKKIDNLSLEYHRSGNIQNIRRRLEKLGFKTKFDRAIPNKWFGWMVNAPLLSAWK